MASTPTIVRLRGAIPSGGAAPWGRHDVPTTIGGPRDRGTHPSRGHVTPLFRPSGRVRSLTLPPARLTDSPNLGSELLSSSRPIRSPPEYRHRRERPNRPPPPSGDFQLAVPPPFQASRSHSRSSSKSRARIPMTSQSTRMRQTLSEGRISEMKIENSLIPRTW
jgi:hypothetical protein